MKFGNYITQFANSHAKFAIKSYVLLSYNFQFNSCLITEKFAHFLIQKQVLVIKILSQWLHKYNLKLFLQKKKKKSTGIMTIDKDINSIW